MDEFTFAKAAGADSMTSGTTPCSLKAFRDMALRFLNYGLDPSSLCSDLERESLIPVVWEPEPDCAGTLALPGHSTDVDQGQEYLVLCTLAKA